MFETVKIGTRNHDSIYGSILFYLLRTLRGKCLHASKWSLAVKSTVTGAFREICQDGAKNPTRGIPPPP